METTRLWSLTGTEVLALLNNNTITVQEYALSLLSHIKERDGIVHAWTYLDRDLVLDRARALDKTPQCQRGPLHGLAVAIKDVIDTEDMPTQFGSPLYQGYRPTDDASAVAILRSAGALIFGKTTTTEFTVLNAGPNTTNPHDRRRTPGGSSAGSAAAVADFQVPLSVGTQNGGSIIRPASYTGIFAMKPTWNAISPEGTKLVSFSIDTVGYFARSIEDLQILADVFALEDNRLPQEIPKTGVKVASIKTPIWPLAGPGTIEAMTKASNILNNAGIHVEEIEFPPRFNDAKALRKMHTVVLSSEARRVFLKEYRRDKTKLDPKIRRFVENASNFTRIDSLQATDHYAEMRPIFDQIAAKYDAMITPSAPDVAPIGLGDMGDSGFNLLWTGLHMPVVHVPAFTGEDGSDMPVGISIVAGRSLDQHLLRISKILSEPLMAKGGWKITKENAGY